MADWKKKQSLTSALAQILIAAVIMVGGVFLYVQRGSHRKEIADRLKEAHAAALHDNPADLQRALKNAEDILAIDAKSGEALAFATDVETELWLTHHVPGADAKAREYLASTEASGSHSEDRYGNKVLQLVADGKADEALQYTEELRKQGASSAKLWFGIAEASEAVGNLDVAKQAFVQATDKAWKNPRYASAAAEALIDEGQLDLAIEMANKGISANPDHIRSRIALGVARARKRDHVKDAADAVKDILSRDADLTPGLKARALVLKAEVAIFEQRYDDAIAAAQAAAGVDPTSYTALWSKGRAQALKKDRAALATFKAAAAARKTAPAIYVDGAQLLVSNGNTEGALVLLSNYEDAFKGVTMAASDGKTVAWMNRDDRYWLAKGDVLKAAGKADPALAAYDKAIAAGGINGAKAHYAKGVVYIGKKEYDKAAEELKLVTPEDGTGHLPEAYLAMGEILFAKKDFPTGCQNYAFALAQLKNTQAPRERLNGILEDVNKKLIAAGQSPVAKLWMKEAKPIIQ